MSKNKKTKEECQKECASIHDDKVIDAVKQSSQPQVAAVSSTPVNKEVKEEIQVKKVEDVDDSNNLLAFVGIASVIGTILTLVALRK